MPSNALKISQLMERLANIQAVHGDLDVVLALPRAAEVIAVDGSNLGVATNFPWGRLRGPVLAFGVWSDPQTAEAQIAAGKPYMYTHTASDFTFDRHSAPAGRDVIAWTRNSGEQKAVREEDDMWFVFDEKGRRVQFVSQGVLGWRLP